MQICMSGILYIVMHSLYRAVAVVALAPDSDFNLGARATSSGASQIDPEIVQLASQLVQRQSGKYDAADLEDHYETRLRAMIDAKLKGEGLDVSEPEEPAHTNVVDLMAALKKSLGQTTEETNPAPVK